MATPSMVKVPRILVAVYNTHLRGSCGRTANSGSVTKPSTESGQDQCLL
jgi:hypothetical protein